MTPLEAEQLAYLQARALNAERRCGELEAELEAARTREVALRTLAQELTQKVEALERGRADKPDAPEDTP